MSSNDVTNLLLMIGVGLLVGSIAATGCLTFGVDAATALIVGGIAAVWAAAIIGIFARW